jgi:hypothetical protein
MIQFVNKEKETITELSFISFSHPWLLIIVYSWCEAAPEWCWVMVLWNILTLFYTIVSILNLVAMAGLRIAQHLAPSLGLSASGQSRTHPCNFGMPELPDEESNMLYWCVGLLSCLVLSCGCLVLWLSCLVTALWLSLWLSCELSTDILWVIIRSAKAYLWGKTETQNVIHIRRLG